MKKNIDEHAEILDFNSFKGEIDDPMRDLLNEFEEIEAQMEQSENFMEDECFANYVVGIKEDEDLIEYYNEQMKVLEESLTRIKFYMDEIEINLLES